MDRFMPNECHLIGFSWLLKHLDLTVPLQEYSSISEKWFTSQTLQKENWIVFDKQYQIKNTPYAHLEFAIKHEMLDLLALKCILKIFSKQELLSNIQENPKRILAKKIWFYYEFLLNERLPIEDLPAGKYDDLLNPKRYFTKKHPLKSKRHKINNNLLGTAHICPIILRTEQLESYIASNLTTDISTIINSVSKSLIRRASSF